jgi:HEPN domain-containing protein
VKIVYEKEWFSTVEARKQPGRENSREVDDQAAAIVLQRYLDKVNGPGTAPDEEYEEEDAESDSAPDSW